MGAAKKLLDKKVLRDLVPINALSEVHVEEISKKAIIEEVRPGRFVFKKGDRDYQSVYLLDGKIELIAGGRDVVGTVEAGSEAARHPLAHKQPRQMSARASGKVIIARIDSSLLDVLLTWDESSGYNVVEIDAEENDDWMTRMLQSQAFLKLPPSNIHQLLMRLESIGAAAGEVIVKQGSEGDYFYIVKSGRLAVSRKPSAQGKEVLLAELGEGACFGEEALVSGTLRNASVTMLTEGTLMRLSKDDFNELLRGPLVHELNFAAAQEMVANGARWLDVRLPGEFENQALAGSTNLPLSALRDQCSELDSDTSYIVCCDTGRRSAAGAFVLSQRGFTVYTLKNGLMDVPEEALPRDSAGAASAGESDTDAEIIPFGSEGKTKVAANQSVGAGNQKASDQALKARLKATEAETSSLKQQLGQALKQLSDAQAELRAAASRGSKDQALKDEFEKLRAELNERELQIEEQSRSGAEEKSGLQADLAAAKQALENTEQRLKSAEKDKKLLKEEQDRLQNTLVKMQESAEGRDEALAAELKEVTKRLEQSQQEHGKQAKELEEQLSQVREDYHQLGQRASALAGERDAAVKGLEKIQQELSALKQQASAQQSDAGTQLDSLKQSLDEKNEELEREKRERRSLEQKLSELDAARKELDGQVRSFDEQSRAASTRASELQDQLAKAQQKLRDGEQLLAKAGDREQSLQKQLQGAEQKSQNELDQLRQQAAAEKEKLEQENNTLQSRLDEQSKRLEDQGSSRSELEQKLCAAEQSLAEAENSVQEANEKLAQGEKAAQQVQQQLDQSRAHADNLREQLDEARTQVSEFQARASETESRLTAIEKEHASDVKSVRDALARAQDERENVKRDQARLMEQLRKSERDLERERDEHEAEVRRLHKELKEASGESSAGLAAELEALQEQLKESTKERGELEIQLGQRSAQLEDLQAEVQKLGKKLQQAQDSARQAEQQLVEANQAANEEMTVRMDAEQKAQQALRDELQALLSERNGIQEQLTIKSQELDELHNALREAQSELVAREDSAQALQGFEARLHALNEELQQAKTQRDQAIESQQQAEQELARVRVEAEAVRDLECVEANADVSDAGFREELEQARNDAIAALGLRKEAEQRSAELEQEVDRLQRALSEMRSDAAVEVESGRVDSLDVNDPHASALLDDVFDELDDDSASDDTLLRDEDMFGEPGDDDSASDSTVLLSEDESVEPAVRCDGAETREPARSGTGKVIAAVLLIGGLAADGALWWFTPQSDSPVPGDTVQELEQRELPENGERLADVQQSEQTVPGKNPEPAIVAALTRGAPETPVPESAAPSAPAEQDVAEEAAPEPQPETAAKASAGADVNPESGGQPVRTFRDALAGGGSAPTMVELGSDSFDMGSGSASPNFEERPRHKVTLKRFAISKHEVTFDQYDRFAKASGRSRPSHAGWGRGERPVINVRWQDAVAYTQWLSSQTGHRYRLPSEAEWEFAARSGSIKRYWWGNKVGKNNANCFDCGSEWAGRSTAPVGSFQVSAYGLADMAGNVREWVQDCYVPNYNNAPGDGGAVESGACTERVVRGGSYSSPSSKLRSTARDHTEADARANDLGFRVVREF
jgi:formylglycine-generating enzyme required for sulfatase activity/CRP-like cAMP-binding protein/chromosome segregation ATPase